MPVYSSLLLGLCAIGAFNAFVLAGLWFASARGDVLRQFWPVPALALTGGVVVLLIGADHAGLSGSLHGLEWVLTAASGALLVEAISRMSGRPAGPWPFAAAVAGLAADVLLAPRAGIPVLQALVVMQWGFTAWAFWIWRAGSGHRQTRQAGATLLLVFGALHLAQATRMLAPDIFRDLVPMGMSIAFAALTILLLLRSRSLNSWFRPASPDDTEAAGAALASLEAWMDRDKAFRRPDLRLADAALAAGVRAEDLSRWLNDRGQSFPDWLTDIRLRAAAAILRDSAERRTSIEAVGLMCGFASRSGFYKAFNRRYGVTPAAYRRQEEIVR